MGKLASTAKHSRVARLATFPGSRSPICWSPDGSLLVTGAEGGGFLVWDADAEALRLKGSFGEEFVSFAVFKDRLAAISQRALTIFDLRSGEITDSYDCSDELGSVSWSPDGQLIATSDQQGILQLWSPVPLKPVDALSLSESDPSRRDVLLRVVFSPNGMHLAGASYDAWVWDVFTGEARRLESGAGLYDVAWSPDRWGKWVAGASSDKTVQIWESRTGKKLAVLEGHSGHVRNVGFADRGGVLGSAGDDGTLRLWSTSDWSIIGRIPTSEVRTRRPWEGGGVGFRPKKAQVAVPGQSTGAIQLWSFPARAPRTGRTSSTVAYKSARIVLVGDSGVGKTGLGWRLAHQRFKEHASTHGQQFWILDSLSTRTSTTQREAVLWDLAGQADYRLIHALFLDDADIALLLFDPAHAVNPLAGAEYWAKQLRLCERRAAVTAGECPPAALVAARVDRGTARLTDDEIQRFCEDNGLLAYFATSAATGEGIDQLVQWLGSTIPWNEKPATVTTKAFKHIKDYVLKLKEDQQNKGKVLVTIRELGLALRQSPKGEEYTDEVVGAAVQHLSNHGYVALLRTAKGGTRILLVPELLNNLAASFILEARRNARGLGSLAETNLHNYDSKRLEASRHQTARL